jgi:hypothetical protein
MVRVLAVVRQSLTLGRSRRSPSRHQSPRGPVRGTVWACRSRMSLTGCMWSVGAARAGRKKGPRERVLGFRGEASGRPHPRFLYGRTAAAVSMLYRFGCVVIRGTYASVWLAVGLVIVGHGGQLSDAALWIMAYNTAVVELAM